MLKMKGNLALVIFFFLFTFYTQESKGIRCYVCYGNRCGDPFNPFNISLVNCISGTCGKAKTENNVVERSCLPIPLDKEYCEKEDVKGAKGVGCVCHTDRCNAASSITISTTTSFIVFGIFLEIVLLI